MAYTGKILADGQVAGAIGDMYQVPVATTAFVRSFTIYNTGVGVETVILYLDSGSGARVIARVALAANEGADILEGGQSLVLQAGVKIQGETTTATTVDFVLTGVESA